MIPTVDLILHPFPMEYGAATTQAAASVVRVQGETATPIVPVWISDRTGGGYDALVAAGMAPVRSIGKAVRAVERWAAYGRWKARSHAAWVPRLLSSPPSRAGPSVTLGEAAAKAWLSAAGVVVLPAALVATCEAACAAADRIGYPVVAKIVSAEIVHKSDVGGVAVGLIDRDAVVAAWHAIHAAVAAAAPHASLDGVLIEKMAPAGGVETFVGVHRDPVFGPMLTFGLGGIYVEIFKDVTRRLLPLTPADAAEMVREVRCFALLDGARGRPLTDVAALERLLLKISDVVAADPDLEEMDLNPVWVGAVGQGAIPLDAVVVRRVGAR